MYFIVVGCGNVGTHLARIMADEHNVVVIDKSEQNLERLKPVFNGIIVIGNGMNLDTLKQAGIEKCDALAAVTSDDNTNIVIGQIARKIFDVPKCVIRINDPEKSEVYLKAGYVVVNGANLVAEVVREKLIARQFSTYVLESSKLTLLETVVDEKKAGKTVENFNLSGEFQIVTVVRSSGPVIPERGLLLEKGDLLIGVVNVASLKRVKKMLEIP